MVAPLWKQHGMSYTVRDTSQHACLHSRSSCTWSSHLCIIRVCTQQQIGVSSELVQLNLGRLIWDAFHMCHMDHLHAHVAVFTYETWYHFFAHRELWHENNWLSTDPGTRQCWINKMPFTIDTCFDHAAKFHLSQAKSSTHSYHTINICLLLMAVQIVPEKTNHLSQNADKATMYATNAVQVSMLDTCIMQDMH